MSFTDWFHPSFSSYVFPLFVRETAFQRFRAHVASVCVTTHDHTGCLDYDLHAAVHTILL